MKLESGSKGSPGPLARIPDTLAAVVAPGRYFEARSPDLPVKPALAAALVAATLSAVASAVAMWAIITGIPPGATFQVSSETVAARSAAWDVARRRLGYLVPGTFLAWVAMVAAVHLGSLMDASAGDVTDSTAVASWAMVPLSVEGVVRGLALAALLWGSNPAASLDALKREVAAAVAGLQGSFGVLLQSGGAAWMGYVVFQGLRHGRGMRRDGAALVAGSLALVVVLLGMV